MYKIHFCCADIQKFSVFAQECDPCSNVSRFPVDAGTCTFGKSALSPLLSHQHTSKPAAVFSSSYIPSLFPPTEQPLPFCPADLRRGQQRWDGRRALHRPLLLKLTLQRAAAGCFCGVSAGPLGVLQSAAVQPVFTADPSVPAGHVCAHGRSSPPLLIY